MSLGVGRTVGRGAQRASSHVKRAIACSSSVGTTSTGIADSGAEIVWGPATRARLVATTSV